MVLPRLGGFQLPRLSKALDHPSKCLALFPSPWGPLAKNHLPVLWFWELDQFLQPVELSSPTLLIPHRETGDS